MGRHGQPSCDVAAAGGAPAPRQHISGSLAVRHRHRRPGLSLPALGTIAVVFVGWVSLALASRGDAHEAGGVASPRTDGATERSRRAIEAAAAAAGGPADAATTVLAVAVVLAMTLVLGGAVLVGFFTCKPKRAIEAQVTETLDLDGKRPRFQYVEFKQEVSLKKANPKDSIEVARQSISVTPNGLSAVDRHSGYIEVDTDEEPMFDDNVGGAVIMRSSSSSFFPSLARRPSSSTFEAFLNIEGAASSFPVISPTANDKAALPDDGEETFSGFGSAPLGLGVGESSGVNPLFGMVDGDETFNGFEAADSTEEAGFGFGFGGELSTNDFGGSTTVDDGGEEEKFGFGAGFGVVDVLPDGTTEKIDAALDVLNNRETTIEEREESIDILLEIMKMEGGVQEVYEMNGAVTIAAVMKEELDMEIQRKALMALNNICDIPTGLAEVVTSGMVPTMVNALDIDELWFYALVILDNAKSNEIAIFTMLGEGILAKLAGRSSTCTDEFELQLMIDLIETLTKNAIKYENIGMRTFDAISCIIRNNPETKDKAKMAVANAVATFGDRAVADVNACGLQGLLP